MNRGRHIDHPDGCHSIRTKQCPTPHPPFFEGPDALPAAQPTMSKPWRQLVLLIYLAKRGNTKIYIFHLNAVLVKSAAAVGLCCTHIAILLKEKLSSVLYLIASDTFVVIVRYAINTVHWLSLRLKLPSFTQWPTPWQSWLTQHVGNRQQDPRSCLVHPVDRFDSAGWFSCNQTVIF